MRNLIVLAMVASVSVAAAAQQKSHAPMAADMHANMAMKMMTTAEKIANAMSAAPREISGSATILDWPAKEGDKPAVLRAGTNGWSCLPDMPQSEGNDPLCLDEPWMQWVDAYMTHTAPKLTRVGVGYMTAPGGGFTSNTDPFAMKQTPDNHWGHHAPHVMIVVPDVRTLDGISTDPNNGGPYVMYPGTPYAHIMAPIVSGAMKSSSTASSR